MLIVHMGSNRAQLTSDGEGETGHTHTGNTPRTVSCWTDARRARHSIRLKQALTKTQKKERLEEGETETDKQKEQAQEPELTMLLQSAIAFCWC